MKGHRQGGQATELRGQVRSQVQLGNEGEKQEWVRPEADPPGDNYANFFEQYLADE